MKVSKSNIKTHFFVLSLFVSLTSFGQQFLWTTNKNGLFQNSEMKVISKDEVLDKLKSYYNTYDVYFDGTGFTKVGFFKNYETSNSYNTVDKTKWELFKKSIFEINELTITCIKSNEGTGSNVMILIINKNNFDSIIFSNSYEIGYIPTFKSDLSKFERFFNALIEN